MCIDAEDYVGVAHSEEKSMKNYVGGIDLANDILFLAAYKNWPSFASKGIDCHLYLITDDVRHPLIIEICDVKLGDYLVGTTRFTKFRYNKKTIVYHHVRGYISVLSCCF